MLSDLIGLVLFSVLLLSVLTGVVVLTLPLARRLGGAPATPAVARILRALQELEDEVAALREEADRLERRLPPAPGRPGQHPGTAAEPKDVET